MWKWIIFGIGITGALGCSAIYLTTFGVTELCINDTELISYNTVFVDIWDEGSRDNFPSSLPIYISDGGGLTWQSLYDADSMPEYYTYNDPLNLYVRPVLPDNAPRCSRDSFDARLASDWYHSWYYDEVTAPLPREWQVETTSGKFRIVTGDAIYRVGPDSKTIKEFDIAFLSNAARHRYFQKVGFNYSESSNEYIPGPLDVEIDPTTGNLVLAMGLEGVLVRSSEGTWHWVTIGPYIFAEIERIDGLLRILWFNLLQFLPVISLFALVRSKTRYWLVLFIFGWLIWLPTSVLTPFVVNALDLENKLIYFFIIASGILLLLLYVTAIPILLVLLWRNYRRPIPVLAQLVGIFILYIVPYVFWVRGNIPSFTFTAVISTILSSIGLYFAYRKEKTTTIKQLV